MRRQPCVYILANRKYGATYIGVTSQPVQRMFQHRNGSVPGHTSKHKIYRLVYFEMFEDMATAIAREKQLKNWHRDWKTNLIDEHNPEWLDLALDWGFEPVR